MITTREFTSADRYVYNFGLCSSKNDFAQVDTGSDAWYHGIWANPFKRIIFTYCEGDCTTSIADTDLEFIEEMQRIRTWYNENSRFIGIDPGFNEPLKTKFSELGLGELLH